MNLQPSSTYRLRMRLIVFSVLFAIPLLIANVVPKAKCELPVSHDGEFAAYSNCELHYGWPKTSRIDTIAQETNCDMYLEPRYSIGHLLGLQRFKIATIRRSELAIASNASLAISTLLLLVITIQCLTTGRFSIRLLLATITLVGIITSSVLCACPL